MSARVMTQPTSCHHEPQQLVIPATSPGTCHAITARGLAGTSSSASRPTPEAQWHAPTILNFLRANNDPSLPEVLRED